MKTPQAVAIYARISSDPSGAALGVERQLQDCRRLARERGWTVAAEYVDNDLSAYKASTARPAYRQMLADLEAGVRDAVIVYNMDRLTRQPIQLEEFAALCERAGVRQVATVTADVDLGTDDGLFMARVFAAFAAKESGRRSERIKRKHQQLAEQGLPNGGHHRPFGYAQNHVTVVESEAETIRTLVARLLAGESMRSLAAWLNAEGIASVTGSPWRTPTLRSILTSARIAGLREQRGQVVGPAVWEAIITPAQRDRVLAVLAAKKVSGRRAPRRYLLSGMLRCGKCGNRLFSSPRGDKRRYVCVKGPDHGGCGQLTVVAEPVELLLTEAVLLRLDTPELADALAGRRSADDRQAALVSELDQDRAQMDELSGLYAARAISAKEWIAARGPIEGRIRETERQLAQISGTGALAGLVGNGDELRARWSDGSMTLERQAAIIAAVLESATIGPGVSGARGLDPDRVMPTWRL